MSGQAFRKIHERILHALESEDGKPFEVDVWSRPNPFIPSGATPPPSLAGEGRTCVLEGGACFERAGVNFSDVSGSALPPSATQRHPQAAGKPFRAIGVSVVCHPHNPWVPTSHFNVRMLHAGDSWWFGGGFDLTPYLPVEEDAPRMVELAEDEALLEDRPDLARLGDDHRRRQRHHRRRDLGKRDVEIRRLPLAEHDRLRLRQVAEAPDGEEHGAGRKPAESIRAPLTRPRLAVRAGNQNFGADDRAADRVLDHPGHRPRIHARLRTGGAGPSPTQGERDQRQVHNGQGGRHETRHQPRLDFETPWGICGNTLSVVLRFL